MAEVGEGSQMDAMELQIVVGIQKVSHVVGERARPTMVRRGPPCGAALDARCTGARTDRAPVHRASSAVHVPCNAVRPRLAPGAPPQEEARPPTRAIIACMVGVSRNTKEHAGRAPRASAPAAAARRHGQDPRPRLVPLQSWGAPVYPTIALVSVVGLRLTSHGKLTDTKVSLVSS